MVRIRVTCGGCGIEYTDEYGNMRHALKTAEDGPFECSEAQAGRLVRLGVAVYVPEETGIEETKADDAEPGNIELVHLSREELEKWDLGALKKLAEDMNVKPAGRKKADYIAAVSATEVESEEEDLEEPPDLNAMDPE